MVDDAGAAHVVPATPAASAAFEAVRPKLVLHSGGRLGHVVQGTGLGAATAVSTLSCAH